MIARDYPANEAGRRPSVFTWMTNATIADAAALLGVVVGPDGMACPKCGAEKRDERRPACRVTVATWHCKRCNEGGNVRDFLAFRLLGKRIAKGDRAGFAELARKLDGDVAPLPVRREPPKEPEALRVPAREVDALWGRCWPCDLDEDVARWLVSRGLDPVAAARADLVRAVQTSAHRPAWAPHDLTDRRAVLAGWDDRGRLATLRFRAAGGARPKAVPPSGRTDPRTKGASYAIGGTVLANRAAEGLLREAPIASWDGSVWICEGEPDWLTVALCRAPRAAVFGIWSGSWTQAIANRIPHGADVVIAVHHDATGAKYAAAIERTLPVRARRTPASALDENARWMAETNPERLAAK